MCASGVFEFDIFSVMIAYLFLIQSDNYFVTPDSILFISMVSIIIGGDRKSSPTVATTSPVIGETTTVVPWDNIIVHYVPFKMILLW